MAHIGSLYVHGATKLILKEVSWDDRHWYQLLADNLEICAIFGNEDNILPEVEIVPIEKVLGEIVGGSDAAAIRADERARCVAEVRSFRPFARPYWQNEVISIEEIAIHLEAGPGANPDRQHVRERGGKLGG